jgi:hypothetical protein
VQGEMLAALVRQRYPKMPITETHPKALINAKHLEAQGWSHKLGQLSAFSLLHHFATHSPRLGRANFDAVTRKLLSE